MANTPTEPEHHLVKAGAPTRFSSEHQPPKNGRPVGIVPLIRRQTADGAELVAIMLSIARGEVDVIYPPKPEDEATRRQAQRAAKTLKGKKGTEAAQVAEGLSDLLKPSRPRYLRVADRMAAVNWLANRGWGRTPLVVKVEEDEPLKFNPAQLTPQEQDEMCRLLEKGRPGASPVLTAPGRVDVTPQGKAGEQR